MTRIRVNDEIDAIVRINPGSSAPVLRAINWQGERRIFVGLRRSKTTLKASIATFATSPRATPLDSTEEGSTGRSKALTIPGSWHPMSYPG